MSTHSDFVLDALKPENVYLVRNHASRGTAVSYVPDTLSKRQFEGLHEFLKTTGNLGEFWRTGAGTVTLKIGVIAEDQSDEHLSAQSFKRWHKRRLRCSILGVRLWEAPCEMLGVGTAAPLQPMRF